MNNFVATFYKFVSLSDLTQKQALIEAKCLEQGIKGTILLAQEGINGTICGSREGIDEILSFLRSHSELSDLEHKESKTLNLPFQRLKVKLKKEIVTIGLPEIDPNQKVGTYITPTEWNQLISDPEVVVIDTRNQYEVAIGTFQGAQNPETKSFREFPEYVNQHLDPTRHKKVALFCTGGIRCEKASSYMISQGFQEVYHLKGGILKYLEEITDRESLWQGECFVFDERVALKEGLEKGTHQLCSNCGYPISTEEEVMTCPHCGFTP